MGRGAADDHRGFQGQEGHGNFDQESALSGRRRFCAAELGTEM
jgi:hypothetical protein